ncbi:putative BZIP family transcription factor [Colletotrichum sublineola]|uniref:Putative BZIP family transcription factor n=1 Tax=Colletotrichum sublineola TaxID=1173701 RepID=A0A066WV61_COLSU|nr:putative BZIP family transcription factor [Colletotrichum sublineola]
MVAQDLEIVIVVILTTVLSVLSQQRGVSWWCDTKSSIPQTHLYNILVCAQHWTGLGMCLVFLVLWLSDNPGPSSPWPTLILAQAIYLNTAQPMLPVCYWFSAGAAWQKAFVWAVTVICGVTLVGGAYLANEYVDQSRLIRLCTFLVPTAIGLWSGIDLWRKGLFAMSTQEEGWFRYLCYMLCFSHIPYILTPILAAMPDNQNSYLVGLSFCRDETWLTRITGSILQYNAVKKYDSIPSKLLNVPQSSVLVFFIASLISIVGKLYGTLNMIAETDVLLQYYEEFLQIHLSEPNYTPAANAEVAIIHSGFRQFVPEPLLTNTESPSIEAFCEFVGIEAPHQQGTDQDWLLEATQSLVKLSSGFGVSVPETMAGNFGPREILLWGGSLMEFSEPKPKQSLASNAIADRLNKLGQLVDEEDLSSFAMDQYQNRIEYGVYNNEDCVFNAPIINSDDPRLWQAQVQADQDLNFPQSNLVPISFQGLDPTCATQAPPADFSHVYTPLTISDQPLGQRDKATAEKRREKNRLGQRAYRKRKMMVTRLREANKKMIEEFMRLHNFAVSKGMHTHSPEFRLQLQATRENFIALAQENDEETTVRSSRSFASKR